MTSQREKKRLDEIKELKHTILEGTTLSEQIPIILNYSLGANTYDS